jgi:GAF domain-containing protein
VEKSQAIRKIGFTNYFTAAIQLGIILVALYVTSLHSFLLFHSIVEISGIIISGIIFLIVWNARRYIDNGFFIFLGIGLLFAGCLSLFHLLAYKGMGVFHDGGSNLPTQLWIAARYLAAITFLLAPLYVRKKIDIPLTVISYTAVTLVIIASIFFWKNFPAAFVDGQGMTSFKIESEYVICLIFVVAALGVNSHAQYFDRRTRQLIILSIIASIASEISFTEYVSVYGSANIAGHLFLIISFYLLYLGVIEIALRRPSRNLYRGLKMGKEKLESEVKKRTVELQKSYSSLKKAYYQLELRNSLRKMANSSPDKETYFDNLVNFIREKFEISCVGVRELNEKRDAPYGSCVGFSRSFWKLENEISLKNDQCVCTRVFKGSLEPHEKKVASLGGSFICGNTDNFYTSLSEKEQKKYRGTCFQQGYKSLAAIPIFENDQVIAIVHMADQAEGVVTKEKVRIVESITYLMSIAINKFNSDQKLEEYKRALLVLSEGNRILVHARSEKNIVRDICRMIVKNGGFVGAWIGYPNHDAEKSIKVVTQYGLAKGQIEKYKLTWDKKDKRVFPARYAIMQRKTQVKKYLDQESLDEDFRKFSSEAGFSSVVSLPLINNSVLIGALTIFSRKPDTFHREEIKLLEELASDLAYGISSLRIKKTHEKTQKDLVESYQHLGFINRKISVLLDLDKNTRNKKNAGSYVLKTAISLSQADVGLLYKTDPQGNYNLVASDGIGNNIDEKIKLFNGASYKFLQPLIKKQTKLEIRSDIYNLGCFSLNDQVRCYLIIPLSMKKTRMLKGAIFLGYINDKKLFEQELEFYDVFERHASAALFNARVL